MRACDWDIAWPPVTECLLNIMGVLESTLCRKCEQKEEPFCHVLCQCSTLARYRQENSSSECLEPVDMRSSVRIVLTLALQSGLFVKNPNKFWGNNRLSIALGARNNSKVPPTTTTKSVQYNTIFCSLITAVHSFFRCNEYK